MLKIKDNVDLKELEKYGFEYDEEKKYYEKNLDEDSNYSDLDILRIEEDRIIYSIFGLELEDDSYWYDGELEDYHINKIDDLIKDGLVEKVEK